MGPTPGGPSPGAVSLLGLRGRRRHPGDLATAAVLGARLPTAPPLAAAAASGTGCLGSPGLCLCDWKNPSTRQDMRV